MPRIFNATEAKEQLIIDFTLAFNGITIKLKIKIKPIEFIDIEFYFPNSSVQ